MKTILNFLDIVVPRFLTEEVALADVGDHYEIVCPMSVLGPGERYDAVATMQVFNLFGRGIFPKLVDGPRPWPEANPSQIKE